MDSTPQAQRQRVERCGVNRAATYRLIFTGRGCVEQGHVDVFTSNESCTQSMKPNGARNRTVSRRMCSPDCLAQDGSGLGTEFGPTGTRGGPAFGYGLWSSFLNISVQLCEEKRWPERGSATDSRFEHEADPWFEMRPSLRGRSAAQIVGPRARADE